MASPCLADDVYCRICLTNFHIRTRLLKHIMYKSKKHRCLHRLQKCGEVISYQKALELNAIEAQNNLLLYRSGHKRSYAAKPAHRICGPLPNHALILKLSQWYSIFLSHYGALSDLFPGLFKKKFSYVTVK